MGGRREREREREGESISYIEIAHKMEDAKFTTKFHVYFG